MRIHSILGASTGSSTTLGLSTPWLYSSALLLVEAAVAMLEQRVQPVGHHVPVRVRRQVQVARARVHLGERGLARMRVG